jgi:hypothetical protein
MGGTYLKRKNRTMVYALFMLFVLFVMIEQIPFVEARSPRPRPSPQKIRYRVYGYAKDSTTHAAISGATVEIYDGATYIGLTTTSATGYFNYYCYSYFIVSSFKAKISETGYMTATKSASVFDTRCNMGAVYLYFGPPTYNYTVVGCVKDAATEFDVPKATVKVYTSASYLGLANTNETNGNFTFSYASQQPISSFTVKVSQVYYDEKTKTCTGAGPTFNMEDIELARQYHSEVIAYNDFDYDLLPYMELWSLEPSAENCDTTCADGVAWVSEGSNSPEGTEAYVYGSLDLSSWIGDGDLEIKVIVKVSSLSLNDPLNFHIGIKDHAGNLKWDYDDSWSGIYDTGWMLITETVPESDLQQGGSYRFYWGFIDTSATNRWKKVEISRFEVVGDKYPEGVLEHNLAGVATHPSHDVYDVNHAHDPDTICTVYASSISATNSLGIGVSDSPVIQSAIMISIDNDTYVETGVGYRMTEYNQIDSVCISVEILDLNGMSGVSITPVRDIRLNVEGDDAPLPNDVIGEALFNLLLEDISLVSGLGPYIKFGGHVWHYGGMMGEYRGENHLTHSKSNGKANITFDFKDSYISGASTFPGSGSTDYKMRVQIRPILFGNGGVYRITVSYAVILKNVEVQVTSIGGLITITTETFYETKEYTEAFDYAYFPNNEVHIVECDGTFEDDPFTMTADDSRYYCSTVNGVGWHYVVGDSIQVTVPEIYGNKGLYRMYIDYWDWDMIRLKPVTFYQTQYSWTLEPSIPYYRFRAIYASISNWTRRYAQPTFPFLLHDS